MPAPTDPNFAAIYEKLGALDARMVSVEEELKPLAEIRSLLAGMAADQRASTGALLKIVKFVPEPTRVEGRLARLEAAVFPRDH